MDSKKPNRRGFLKNTAALASLATGGAEVVSAQTPGPAAKTADELVAYGERSRFINTVRIPVAERHSPDEFGLMFHVLTPLQDSYGIPHHAFLSLHYFATHRVVRSFPISTPKSTAS